MRSMKWLLAALILTTVAACGDLQTASGPANRTMSAIRSLATSVTATSIATTEAHPPSASSPMPNASRIGP